MKSRCEECEGCWLLARSKGGAGQVANILCLPRQARIEMHGEKGSGKQRCGHAGRCGVPLSPS